MKECDSQISCILKEQEKLQHKLSEMNIERKKLENEVNSNCLICVLHDLISNNLLSIFLGKTNGDGTKRLLFKGRKVN